MERIDQSPLLIQAPSEQPFVERKLRAPSQEEAHDRAHAVTSKMAAEGRVLVARSWIPSADGGTVTLVYARRHGDDHEAPIGGVSTTSV